jgi:hypothetical protein
MAGGFRNARGILTIAESFAQASGLILEEGIVRPCSIVSYMGSIGPWHSRNRLEATLLHIPDGYLRSIFPSDVHFGTCILRDNYFKHAQVHYGRIHLDPCC